MSWCVVPDWCSNKKWGDHRELSFQQAGPKLLGDDDNTDKLYWVIQAANNIATLALERAGYDAGLLKATFKEKEEDDQLITVPNTIVRQQALANARGHGG